MILLTIKHPIGELALALVRVLRSVGRFSEALRVLGSCVAAGSDAPLFDFQKAKVLQSLGLDSDSLPYFESAVLGFEARLGTDHITTQSCRCELAIQCIRSGDSKGAKLILAGLAKFFEGKIPRTKKERQLSRVLKQLGLPANLFKVLDPKSRRGQQMSLALKYLPQQSVLGSRNVCSTGFNGLKAFTKAQIQCQRKQRCRFVQGAISTASL